MPSGAVNHPNGTGYQCQGRAFREGSPLSVVSQLQAASFRGQSLTRLTLLTSAQNVLLTLGGAIFRHDNVVAVGLGATASAQGRQAIGATAWAQGEALARLCRRRAKPFT
jgi:hypothetical protein